MTFAASGTMQCACTSMVLTRLPLTTTSRRPCAFGCPPEPPPGPAAAPAVMSHPTNAMFAGKSPLIGISIPSIDELSDFSLLRQASAIPSVYADRHNTVIKHRVNVRPESDGGVGGSAMHLRHSMLLAALVAV